MKNTKENILLESLRLFAQNGFDGVSMRDIAKRIGITQGAIYRHYASKQELFDSILRKMEEYDQDNAERWHLPVHSFATNPQGYQNIAYSDLLNFTMEMFRYWTENEFASAFRKMLTLEQYRSAKMNTLYQQYFGQGVLTYLQDIFSANGYDDPELEALHFYGQFFFLLNQYDAADNKSHITERMKRCLS